MFGKYGKQHHGAKPVIQLSQKGEFIREWDCAKDAYRELGFNYKHISSVCLGNRKTANGFKWKFK